MTTQKINNTVNQPIQFLQQLRKYVFPNAILAGGAVRDRYFNITPSDYDIYIGIPQRQTLQPANIAGYLTNVLVSQNIVRSETITHQKILYDRNSNYTNCNHIYEIIEMVIDQHIYQFMFVDTDSPEGYVEHEFDLGICKAFCDGKKLHYTKDFLHDARNKKITVVGGIRSEAQLNRTMNFHVPKVQAKFPNFTVEVADHIQQYIQIPF